MKPANAHKHSGIQYKLAGGFCLILALGLAGYANMVHAMRASAERNSRIASVVNQSISLSKDVALASHDTSSYTLAYIYTGKTTYREFKWQADENANTAFQDLEAAIGRLPHHGNLLANYAATRKQRMEVCAPLEDASVHLEAIGNPVRARDLYELRSQPAQYRLEIDLGDMIDRLSAYQSESERADAGDARKAIVLGWIVQGMILAASVLIALAISWATRNDIHDLLRTQIDLSDTENRLQAIVTGAPIIVFALDTNGVYTLSEGSALSAIDRKPGEAVGSSIFERHKGNSPIQEQFQRALAGEKFLASCEIRGVAMEVWYAPQFDDRGQICGVLGVATDVTARVEAQRRVDVLVANLEETNRSLAQAYDATIQGWSAALDLRDKETEGHSRRVTEMAIRVATNLGLDTDEIEHIRRGALLHDIGEMGIPDSVLLKPGPLTDEEWVVMRMHPQYAHDFLSGVEFLRPALDIPLRHHEKWDGGGYPSGLQGEAIPLSARIFAVVDVWDALSSDRPYREAWPRERVMAHIQSLSGSHFDPIAVQAFLVVASADEYCHASALRAKPVHAEYAQAAA